MSIHSQCLSVCVCWSVIVFECVSVVAARLHIYFAFTSIYMKIILIMRLAFDAHPRASCHAHWAYILHVPLNKYTNVATFALYVACVKCQGPEATSSLMFLID